MRRSSLAKIKLSKLGEALRGSVVAYASGSVADSENMSRQ